MALKFRAQPDATGPQTIAAYEEARRAGRSCPPHDWTRGEKATTATCSRCPDLFDATDPHGGPGIPHPSAFRPTMAEA